MNITTGKHHPALTTEHRTMDKKRLVTKIIKFAQNKGLRIHRGYSGRCMFGRRCLGLVGDLGPAIVTAEFVKRKTGYSYSRDAMGLDAIVYFPDIEDNGQ